MILLSPDANQANFKNMAATVCSIPLFFFVSFAPVVLGTRFSNMF